MQRMLSKKAAAGAVALAAAQAAVKARSSMESGAPGPTTHGALGDAAALTPDERRAGLASAAVGDRIYGVRVPAKIVVLAESALERTKDTLELLYKKTIGERLPGLGAWVRSLSR